MSACNYQVQDIEYDFLSFTGEARMRLSLSVNGKGFTWDENGNIVSYRFGNREVHVDKDGNFAGLIIDGTGITASDIDKYSKEFLFSTKLPNGDVAHSACFYLSKAKVVKVFNNHERVFSYHEKPDAILTCQGEVGETPFQTRWHLKNNTYDLIVGGELSQFVMTEPTEYMIDGRLVNMPYSTGLCLEADQQYQACMVKEQPSNNIYLKSDIDKNKQSVLMTSLFAYKIIDSIDSFKHSRRI